MLEFSYTEIMNTRKVLAFLTLAILLADCGFIRATPIPSTPTRPVYNTITLSAGIQTLVHYTQAALATEIPPVNSLPSPPAQTNIPSKTPVPEQVQTLSPLVLSKGPDLIYAGKNTEMEIFWQGTAGKAYLLRWGQNGQYDLGQVDIGPDDSNDGIHTYVISNLQPGTLYEYQIMDGGLVTGGSFHTAPDLNTRDLDYIVYGDTRTNPDLHDQVAGRINRLYQQNPNYRTIGFLTGDLVSGGDEETSWQTGFFDTRFTEIRTELANLPIIPAAGNHDGVSPLFAKYFPFPYVAGRYWSFDYGPAHFVVLDQYTPYGVGSEQYEWFKGDLQKNQRIWTFVMLHEPGWSAGGGHSNNETVQNDLQPLFLQYGVSIVFSAHNHYYARAEKDGIFHLTVGTGGAPAYKPSGRHPEVKFLYNGLGFVRIEIKGHNLDGWFMDTTGKEIDHFQVSR